MNIEHRQILVINGNRQQSVAQCQIILNGRQSFWLSDQQIDSIDTTPFKKARTQLGQENTAIVFDAIDHFDANALGAVAGTLIGGGLLILLLPANTNNHQQPRFIKRLNTLLTSHNIKNYAAESVTTNVPLYDLPVLKPVKTFELTAEQQTIASAIINVAKGRRKRPLVITADRGRGKTSVLGAAALALTEKGIENIIVCAPAKAMVQPLFQHAAGADNLTFYAPDELDQKRPTADLVIIDEAGAIPVPLLTRLLQHYSRIVFSTTVLGYEGNGRGFAIRFQDQLDQYTPSWRSATLEAPIRWAVNDPLESLLNDLLLLGTAATELTMPVAQDKITYQQVSSDQLIEDEYLLRQIFGLLVIAHYQTRPSDLLQLLDSDDLSIYTLMLDDKVVAVAVVSHEGGLDAELTQSIFEGKRRPQGHLVPQVLTFQSGIPNAACLRTDRIMRIAVHPECQNQTLGTELLAHIRQHSTADYLSTSFGLSSSLLNFWSKSGYRPIHLGLKREASSGYHSAVFILPMSAEGETLLVDASSHFSRNFVALLADALKTFKPNLVLVLLKQYQLSANLSLSIAEQRDIIRFSQGQCGYDLVMASLKQWLPPALAMHGEQLTAEDAQLLVMRVLQHHDWASCCSTLSITGKQFALVKMQQAVATLAGLLASTDCPRNK
ncbi:GNAT family N-acetyltransferase [Leucothrix arctica]|uniref:tRNA(Met) cytidine acetyltransferase TmcA n=1 Tax=Leucothrix arctica TaxID=1481894 RepID=A0A317C7F5_9GAMM|nr:GNAT family N-acetyltransferase [Leucothrix arctica]PWQ94217.1 hypothetical protein DKT75_16925 [Leucothrix arctica]